MKIICLISLLSVILVSCDGGGDDPSPSESDTIAPVITIEKPAANEAVLLIDKLEIIAQVTDNNQLDNVRVVLNEPGGGSRVLSDVTITLYTNFKKFEINEMHLIPKHAPPGDYTLTVEAKDKGLNVALGSRTFALHALDINHTAFAGSFYKAMLSSKFTQNLLNNGYSPWDYGYAYDKVWVSVVMFMIVDTDNNSYISEAEWESFNSDFSFRNQSWAQWDENSDGNLELRELHNGLSNLNIFTDWDSNQDELFDTKEIADGIFNLWDLNNDGLLSKDEYQEKFYTYLYRE